MKWVLLTNSLGWAVFFFESDRLFKLMSLCKLEREKFDQKWLLVLEEVKPNVSTKIIFPVQPNIRLTQANENLGIGFCALNVVLWILIPCQIVHTTAGSREIFEWRDSVDEKADSATEENYPAVLMFHLDSKICLCQTFPYSSYFRDKLKFWENKRLHYLQEPQDN